MGLEITKKKSTSQWLTFIAALRDACICPSTFNLKCTKQVNDDLTLNGVVYDGHDIYVDGIKEDKPKQWEYDQNRQFIATAKPVYYGSHDLQCKEVPLPRFMIKPTDCDIIIKINSNTAASAIRNRKLYAEMWKFRRNFIEI